MKRLVSVVGASALALRLLACGAFGSDGGTTPATTEAGADASAPPEASAPPDDAAIADAGSDVKGSFATNFDPPSGMSNDRNPSTRMRHSE